MGTETETRLIRWQRGTEWPLTAAALLFLVVYAWQILDPELPASMRQGMLVAAWVAWGLFVGRLSGATGVVGRSRQVLRPEHLRLACGALPLLRPLRLFRLVTLFHVLNRHAGASLRGRVVVYVTGAAALILFVATLAILDA